MIINLPENVKKIINVLMENGHEAYAVGGCVRDSLLSRLAADWDITTSADPATVKRLFRRTVDTGLQHGTVTVLIGNESFEVTTYRIDGVYEDARHPKEVVFTRNLSEDLLRRDFTINAMAYNDRDGLVDLFGGQEDLKNGIIRAVGNPVERFTEDALRILRCVRFAAQLNYDIEEVTLEAAKSLAANLTKISAERIRTELVKLMISDHPEKMRLAYEMGITKVVLPEFDDMMETPQNHPHHMYSVGEHTIHAYCHIKSEEHTKEELTILRLGLLFHDIGKPECHIVGDDGIDHFYGHPVASKRIANDIMRRLKFDNKTIAAVTAIALHHDDRPSLKFQKIRSLISKIGIENFERVLIVREADTMAQSMFQREEKLSNIDETRRMYEEIRKAGDPLFIRDLAVNGNDLISENIAKGKAVGDTLNHLLTLVLNQPELNDRERLLKLAESFVRTLIVFIMVMSLSFLQGCTQNSQQNADGTVLSGNENGEVQVFQTVSSEELLAADDAVIINISDSKILLRTISGHKEYELSYDGRTEFFDKFDGVLSSAQLQPGDVVDATLSVHSKLLKKLKHKPEINIASGVTDFEINKNKGMLSFGGENYRLDSRIPVFFEGKEVGLKGISEGDSLNVSFMDRDAVAIVIDSGHGYLRIRGKDDFVGGWIELGTKIIKPITEDDFLIEVPEGEYDMRISYKGHGGSERVKIERDEETSVDVSSYKAELLKIGQIRFSIEPGFATLKINGMETSWVVPVELEYGVYELEAEALGYDSVKKLLSVGQEEADIEIVLEKSMDEVSGNSAKKTGKVSVKPGVIQKMEKEEKKSSSSSSEAAEHFVEFPQTSGESGGGKQIVSVAKEYSTDTDTQDSQPVKKIEVEDVEDSDNGKGSSSSTEYTRPKLYVDSPEGAEVYLDGSYKGIAPVSFTKTTGTHVITLRADGYISKTYTITVGSDTSDETYSFNGLIQEGNGTQQE